LPERFRHGPGQCDPEPTPTHLARDVDVAEPPEGNTIGYHPRVPNLRAVCEAAGGDLSNIVKLNIFLTDMERFAEVNEIMKRYFTAPFPARAAIAVRALPRDVQIEIEGVMAL